MKVRVQHGRGRLILPPETRSKEDVKTIFVDVPDDIIEDPKVRSTGSALGKAHEMLGETYSYAPSGKSDKELFMEALEERYGK